jgi:putative component of membrane protein insertase Oxa1/YidC/SpoIIIJ protein YidD
MLKRSWKSSGIKLSILLFVFSIVYGDLAIAAADQFRSPWSQKKESHQETTINAFDNPSTLGVVFDFYVSLFQRYISPVDGARCQLYPTCSQYARLCIRKHGGALGFIMSADRLLRDNFGVSQYYPMVWHHNRYFYFDPPRANDFWFNLN